LKSLNKKIGLGMFWALLEVIFSRGGQIIFTIFLAALLTPDAFGLVAIVAVIFELSNVMVNAGFAQGLIRAKSVTERQLSTAFWGNLALAFFLYLVIYLISPWVANFYAQPVIEPMIQILGLGVVINAFRIVQTAILSRDMNFKAQMMASALGVLLSGVGAVILAREGFGVWSLVFQMLASQGVATLAQWVSSRWVPTLEFSKDDFLELFTFGKYLLVANVINVVFKNVYALVIAKLFTPEVTGLYYFANRITGMLSQQLAGVAQRASFPALSTLQDDDVSLRIKYQQLIQISLFVMAPVMIFLGVLAEPVFMIFFGDKWSGAVLYVQILALSGFLYPVHSLNINVLMVKGRSDLNLRLNLIKKFLHISLLIPAIAFGPTAIVASQLLGTVVSLLPNTYYTGKLIGYNAKMQFKDMFKPLMAGVISGVVVFLCMDLPIPNTIILLIISLLAGSVCYLGVSLLIGAEGAALLWGVVQSKLHRPSNRK